MATKESMMSFIHKSPKEAGYEAYRPDEDDAAPVDTAPKLEILSCPVATTKKMVVVSGSIEDDEARQPRLFVNQKEVVTRGGKWLASLKIEDGINRVVVMATNNTGKTVFESRDIFCGTLPPIIEINALPELTAKTSVTISGNVKDLNMGATEQPIVSINGNAVPVGADGQWTYAANLADGENAFAIAAQNGAKIPAIAKKVIVKAAALPEFCLKDFSESSPTSTSVINGTLISPNGGKKCRLRVNDQEVTVADDGSFTAKIKHKRPSVPTKFTIIGDATYNISKQINFDPPPPVNVITKCEPSQKRILYRVAGAATDETASISSVLINGKEMIVNGGSWSTTLTVNYGFTPLEIITKNSLGKTSAMYGCIYVERRPPVIEITQYPESTKEPEADISGTVKDPDAELAPIVTVNDKRANINGDKWEVTIPLVQGGNLVKVVASSDSGLTAEAEVNINCTIVYPSLKVLNCPRQTDSPELILRGFARSGYAENLHAVKVSVNGKPIDFSEGKWTHQVTLDPGENTFIIAAVNDDGERVEVEKQVIFNA